MQKHLLIIALLIIPFIAESQHTIILKDSSVIHCAITSVDSLNVYFDMNENDQVVHASIPTNKVKTVYYRYYNPEFEKPNNVADHTKEISFDTLSFKLSTLIISGEVPVIFEYRPCPRIGNEFSAGFAYMAYKFGASNDLGVGYALKYGLRIYFNKDNGDDDWGYVCPQVFYKQLWIKNRDYNSDYRIIGSGGADSYNEYLYSENRQVFGFQLIIGSAKCFLLETREFYFGVGVRYITSYQQITKWLKTETPYNASDYPLSSKTVSGFSPSIQFGWNYSFPVTAKRR
jgi:hypothetical protein